MKKKLCLTLAALGLFATFNASSQGFAETEAQGYSSLNQEQSNLALVKAEKKITGGQVLTFICIASEIVGIVVYLNGKTEYEKNPPEHHLFEFPFNQEMATGTVIMAGGGVLLAIGVPTSEVSKIGLRIKLML